MYVEGVYIVNGKKKRRVKKKKIISSECDATLPPNTDELISKKVEVRHTSTR